MIQPNAQVCRRLAGASLECRHSPLPFLPVPLPSVGRSGRVPPARLPPLSCPSPPPIVPLRVPNSLRAPAAVVPRLHHPPLPSPITARKRKCERTGERAIRARTCVGNARVPVCIAPRRRYVTSSHGNQCSWPPTRSHGAKPTRPASFGHLCAKARARASYLSLALSLFLDLSPVALPPRPSRAVRFSSCEPFGLSSFSFFSPVLSSRPPLCIFPRCSVKITPCVPASDISIPSEIDTAREGEEGRRREGYISSNVNSLK